MFNSVFWAMRTGASGRDLPDRYPPYQTCHRRFRRWDWGGTMYRIVAHLARELASAGEHDVSEAFINATLPERSPVEPGGEIMRLQRPQHSAHGAPGRLVGSLVLPTIDCRDPCGAALVLFGDTHGD